MDKIIEDKFYLNAIKAALCCIVSLWFWCSTIDFISSSLFDFDYGILLGILLILALNLLHYYLGWFHVDAIDADWESDKPVLMRNAFHLDYLYVKIIPFVTIGISRYIQRAMDVYNGEIDEDTAESKLEGRRKFIKIVKVIVSITAILYLFDILMDIIEAF